MKILLISAYLILALVIPAIPGFCYFYFARGTTIGVSAFIGILTGQVLLMAFDPLIGAYSLAKRFLKTEIKRTKK